MVSAGSPTASSSAQDSNKPGSGPPTSTTPTDSVSTSPTPVVDSESSGSGSPSHSSPDSTASPMSTTSSKAHSDQQSSVPSTAPQSTSPTPSIVSQPGLLAPMTSLPDSNGSKGEETAGSNATSSSLITSTSSALTTTTTNSESSTDRKDGHPSSSDSLLTSITSVSISTTGSNSSSTTPNIMPTVLPTFPTPSQQTGHHTSPSTLTPPSDSVLPTLTTPTVPSTISDTHTDNQKHRTSPPATLPVLSLPTVTFSGEPSVPNKGTTKPVPLSASSTPIASTSSTSSTSTGLTTPTTLSSHSSESTPSSQSTSSTPSSQSSASIPSLSTSSTPAISAVSPTSTGSISPPTPSSQRSPSATQTSTSWPSLPSTSSFLPTPPLPPDFSTLPTAVSRSGMSVSGTSSAVTSTSATSNPGQSLTPASGSGTGTSITPSTQTTAEYFQSSAPVNYAEEQPSSPEGSTTTGKSSFTAITLGTTYSVVETEITTQSGSSVFTIGVTSSVPVPFVTSVPISPTNQSSTTNSSSDNGALIGGLVGGVTAILLGIGLCIFLRRRRHTTSRQLLRDEDLSVPLSPRDVEIMREAHSFRPPYSSASREQHQETLHQPSQSFGSSAELQCPITPASLIATAVPYSRIAPVSSSAFIEHGSGSNDGYISDDDSTGTSESTSTETSTQFATPRQTTDGSLYTARNDGQTRSSVAVDSGQIGLAIGSHASLSNSFYSARSGQDLLTPTKSNDDDESAYIPSPSEFPAPPLNPFTDNANPIRSPGKRSSVHGAGPGLALTTKQAPSVRTWSMQEASWAAAVAAASPVQVSTPTAKATPSFIINLYTSNSDEKTSQVEVDSPDPSSSLARVSHDRIAYSSARGEGRESSADSHETYTARYFDPFADQTGLSMQAAGSQVQDTGNVKANRLSSTSSGVEIPDNPSECGIAL